MQTGDPIASPAQDNLKAQIEKALALDEGFTPKNISFKIDLAKQLCDQLHTFSKYTDLQNLIISIFEKLEVPKYGTEKDIWSELPKKERELCMQNLSIISGKLLYVRQKQKKIPQENLEDIINISKVFSIQHRIACLEDNPEGIAKWRMHPLELFQKCIKYTIGNQKNIIIAEGDSTVYDENYRAAGKEILSYIKSCEELWLEVEKPPEGMGAFARRMHLAKTPKYLIGKEELTANTTNNLENDFIEKESKGLVEFLTQNNILNSNPSFQIYKNLYPRLYYKKFLPKSYGILKDQSLLLQYFISENLNSITSKDKNDFPISLTAKSDNPETCTLEVPHMEDPKSPQNTISLTNHLDEFPHSIKNKMLLNALDPNYQEKSKDPIYIKKIQDLRNLRFHHNVTSFDISQTVRKQQIPNLLSYFSTNLEELRNKEYQKFFKFLLFESNYLESYIELSPSFRKTLSSFLDNAEEYFSDPKDYAALRFLSTHKRMVNRRLHTSSPSEKEEHEEKSLREIDPFKEEKEILISAYKTKDKANIYQASTCFLLSQEDRNSPFTENEAIDFLNSLLFYKKYQNNASEKSEVDHLINKIIHKKQYLIKKSLNDRILNQVISSFNNTSTVSSAKWDLTQFPFCTRTDKLYSISIEEGFVYSSNKRVTQLPPSFLAQANYQKIFGNKKILVKQINDICFESEDRMSRFSVKNNEVLIQKKIQGEWYQYMPEEEVRTNLSNSLGSSFLKESYSFWKACNAEEPYQIHFINSSESFNPLYSIEMTASSTSTSSFYSLKKLIRCKDQVELQNIYSKSQKNASISHLEKIEDPAYIHVWNNSQGEIEEIDFPRLSFKILWKKNDLLYIS